MIKIQIRLDSLRINFLNKTNTYNTRFIIILYYLDRKLDQLTKQMMLILLGHERLLDVLICQNLVVDLLNIHQYVQIINQTFVDHLAKILKLISIFGFLYVTYFKYKVLTGNTDAMSSFIGQFMIYARIKIIIWYIKFFNFRFWNFRTRR